MCNIMNKVIKTLMDNKLHDGSILVHCTKWNAIMGQQYITVYDDTLYITPFSDGIYGANIKKTIKFNRKEIEDIRVIKSFWTGSKIIIKLKNGQTLKYKLINNSWVEQANLLLFWIDDIIRVVKKQMTVEKAFLLNCRVTAKQLNANEKNFTLSELVHKVVNNDKDAEEWIRICGEKIYNLLKEDIKSGNLNAKIILTKRGEEIVYGKIKFVNIKYEK